MIPCSRVRMVPLWHVHKQGVRLPIPRFSGRETPPKFTHTGLCVYLGGSWTLHRGHTPPTLCANSFVYNGTEVVARGCAHNTPKIMRKRLRMIWADGVTIQARTISVDS